VDPNNLQANLLLADHYESRGNRDTAIQHLRTVAKAAPENEAVKLRLASLYGKAGRFDEGIELARAVATDRPKVAAAHFLLGELLLGQGNVAPAIESLRTAARLEPRSASIQLRLGEAYERKGDLDAALGAYRQAATLAPANARTHNNVAWILASQGKSLEEALQSARKAEALVRANQALAASLPGVLDTLGFVYYKRGEYGLAEPPLRQAAELSTNDPTIQYHLGLTYRQLGRKADAATWLRRSLQGGGKFAGADEARKVLKELGS
jgi:Flp pilus assembly protein TadD